MVGGRTPLVLYASRMKIISCCLGPLACFKYLYNSDGMLSEKLIILLILLKIDCVAGAKRGGGGRKARKPEKGKGALAIRAGIFVFCSPFSELI